MKAAAADDSGGRTAVVGDGDARRVNRAWRRDDWMERLVRSRVRMGGEGS